MARKPTVDYVEETIPATESQLTSALNVSPAASAPVSPTSSIPSSAKPRDEVVGCRMCSNKELLYIIWQCIASSFYVSVYFSSISYRMEPIRVVVNNMVQFKH